MRYENTNYIEISLFIGEFPCLKAYWKGIVVNQWISCLKNSGFYWQFSRSKTGYRASPNIPFKQAISQGNSPKNKIITLYLHSWDMKYEIYDI